jgi:hypothetical protein
MRVARNTFLLLSTLSTPVFAARSFPVPPGSRGLQDVAQWAESIVTDIDQEIAYIQNSYRRVPHAGCEFCDEGSVLALNENDSDVVQHLLRISGSARQIGATALQAANQVGPAQLMLVQQACQLTGATLTDIPSAKATVFWEPRGVARPQTFDVTEQKLMRMKSLLPGCF